MDTRNLIQTMMDASGMTAAELSRALGKRPGYIAALFSQGSVPRLDTFLRMAEAMGFEVSAKGRGVELGLTSSSEPKSVEYSLISLEEGEVERPRFR